MILHCIRKALWEVCQQKPLWGEDDLAKYGFLHCSPVSYFWRVAPNFESVEEELVLLCIDEQKVHSEIRYEDGDGCGRCYPHVYGLMNTDAVSAVLPYETDTQGHWRKNPELAAFPDA